MVDDREGISFQEFDYRVVSAKSEYTMRQAAAKASQAPKAKRRAKKGTDE